MDKSEEKLVPTDTGIEAFKLPENMSSPVVPVTPVGDEGLEERYNKLKAITIKYKKRIAEQNIEIENMKEEKSKLHNASKIQLEFDKALDEIERLRKCENTFQKDLQRTVDENIKLKMKEADATSQIQSLSSSHKLIRERLEKLEKEAEVTNELKEKVESLEKELQEAKEAGVDAQQEKRQLQILSLEVTDYERKLQDAYGSLEGKTVECDKLLNELNERDQKVKELELLISNYKDSEDKLILAKESLQADVTRKAEKIGFLQDEVSKLTERLSEKKTELQKLNQDLETAKLNFSSQSKDFIEKLSSSQKLVSSLEQKVSLLEENKRSREIQITNLKLEIQQLESDYLNYKAKAQAMLKSQKPTTFTDNDELEKLQGVVQDFHSEISILKNDLQILKLENENLLMEKAELNVRTTQLKTDSIEKDVHLNNEIQRLKQELREKEELITNQNDLKLTEIRQMASSFKMQIDTMKEDYEAQIHHFREQCELLKLVNAEGNNPGVSNHDIEQHLELNNGPLQSVFRPIDKSPPLLDDLPVHSLMGFERMTHHSQPLTIETNTSGMSFDQLRMIPRGEGEGSESVNSAYTPRLGNYNISFEQLLSSSFDSTSKNEMIEQDKTVREAIHKELVRCQGQVSHLTSLLRESESNCDRLSQLSDALKEEIRRIERDKERQEHLKENSEYLKNVLLKFVTLTGEAERKRLIPVLKTMLRLTTDEVDKLEKVAEGKDTSHREGTAAGWSLYLPLWPSGNDK